MAPSDKPVMTPEELTEATLLSFDFHVFDVTVALLGDTNNDKDAVSSIFSVFFDGLTDALLTSIFLTETPHWALFPLSNFTVIVVEPEF